MPWDKLRALLVEHGPVQIKQNFPHDAKKRKFSTVHYVRKLANGEEMNREWLLYSKSSDKVFCFCCKLFKKNEISSLSQKGSSDWHNISAILSLHEKSEEHMKNYQKWKDFYLSQMKEKCIDSALLQNLKEKEKYWSKILERLISLVRVLATQNLAFWGSSDVLGAADNGNFLKFIEYLALFDPIMKEHVRKVRNKKTRVHYLGKIIQNELIEILSKAIKDKILKSVRKNKYFSIILDCTPDVSHVEQMSVIIRFVDVSSEDEELKNQFQKNVVVREHFIEFLPLSRTTGEALAETVFEEIENLSLSVENIRGQGYDNGSNMKGKESGLQKRILNVNPRAFFVPCSAHSLNLVVNDAVSCCLKAIIFFDLVQRIYVFFSASTRRWDILKHHIPSLTIKPLSETRWSCRIDALTSLRYNLQNVYDALFEILDDSSLSGTTGNIIKAEAKGLLDKISSYKFIVMLVIWYNIMLQINITSKILQGKELFINLVIKELKSTKLFLTGLRNDFEFNKILVDATEIANDINVEPIFDKETIRKRRKLKMFTYEAKDETIKDPKEKFKIEFYFSILDRAINSIDERFTQVNEFINIFGFLFNLHSVKTQSTSETLELCQKLEKALKIPNKDIKDIDSIGLCSEIRGICHRIPEDASPLYVLKYICENRLESGFPNLFIALRILLTLPMSVASAERSFSKLKLIKTYLRNSMTQERLVGLATISIESEIANSIELKQIIKQFAKLKARKTILTLKIIDFSLKIYSFRL